MASDELKEVIAKLRNPREGGVDLSPRTPFDALRHQLASATARYREAQLAEQRVPTGAPIRSAPDVSALSARDKIAYALTRQDGQ